MRPERSLHYLVLTISAAFLFVLASFSAASAATITVTNTADSGAGSLRAAIAAANPGDTIDFSVTGTITLGSVLTINKDLTIKGPGATNLTVSGDNSYQVFYISGGTVKISGITISDGYVDSVGGGGIYNNGALRLTNVTLSGNVAGTGVGGGGIYNYGANSTLTLTNVTLSGNSAGAGAGISNYYGTVTMTNCTLSGNSTRGGGGGGISNFLGTVTMTNCTFSGNSAGSGGGSWSFKGTVTMTNCTFSGNSARGVGGGVYNSTGSVSLRNTIVANSINFNCAGPITSLGHNLDSADDCGFTGTGDIINTDPELSPLALNAPGTTETMALSSTSPAIDAGGNSNLPPTDQRGAVRIWDGDGNGTAIVDIGAYEYGAPLYIPPPVPAMNEWGMIIFILLAGLGSIYYLRRRAES